MYVLWASVYVKNIKINGQDFALAACKVTWKAYKANSAI